jgi:hypothetical protein
MKLKLQQLHKSIVALFAFFWSKFEAKPNIPQIGHLEYFDLIHLLGPITMHFDSFWLPYRGTIFVLQTL